MKMCLKEFQETETGTLVWLKGAWEGVKTFATCFKTSSTNAASNGMWGKVASKVGAIALRIFAKVPVIGWIIGGISILYYVFKLVTLIMKDNKENTDYMDIGSYIAKILKILARRRKHHKRSKKHHKRRRHRKQI